MSLRIENLSGLNRKVIISLDVENLNNEVKKSLLNKQKKVKMSGFRPGKVPLKMVDGMYGNLIREELINNIASKKFYDFVIDNNIKLARLQKLDLDEKQSNNKEIKINAYFDVFPDNINIIDFELLEVEKPVSKVEDKDIDNTIHMLRKQKAQFELSKQAATIGDRIVINFEGFINNEALKNSKVKDYAVVLGDNKLIPDFEKGIIGMKKNDTKDIIVNFPNDYQDKELAGKEVVFKVNLKKIEKIKLPNLDEVFIKSLGIEDGKLETLKKEISNNLNREISFRSYSLTKKNVLDRLLKNSNLEVPQSLVDQEIKRLKDQAIKNLETQGINKNQLQDLKDNLFKDKAKNSVALGMIINKIIELNNLKVDNKKIRDTISIFAKNYENPEAYMNWYLKDENNLQDAKALALENSVIDLILSKAKVSQKDYSFNEIMQMD